MTHPQTTAPGDWRERLAALEHEQWAHWTTYFFDNLSEENIGRWRNQTYTPYSKLSEEEKESDREWADKVIAESEGELAAARAEGEARAKAGVAEIVSSLGIKVEHLDRFEDWEAAVEFIKWEAEARGREGMREKALESLKKLQYENAMLKGHVDGGVILNAKNGGYVLNDHQLRMDRLFDKHRDMFSPTQGSSK